MIALNLISEEIPTLKPESTISEAQAIFHDYCYYQIPIVKEEQYIGIFPLEMTSGQEEPTTSISQFKEDFILARVNTNQHILNIFETAAESELTVIPVIGEENRYQGAIGITDLLNYFAHIYSFKEVGGIFTLEVPFQNYDLSEIARIVESNNAKILSLFTETQEDSSKVSITVKVNTVDLKHLQATFERYDYLINIHQTYDQQKDDLQERYELLMKYLDI